MLVTFLYSIDFVLSNDASECHAPVCSDETYANKCQEQGRMSWNIRRIKIIHFLNFIFDGVLT